MGKGKVIEEGRQKVKETLALVQKQCTEIHTSLAKLGQQVDSIEQQATEAVNATLRERSKDKFLHAFARSTAELQQCLTSLFLIRSAIPEQKAGGLVGLDSSSSSEDEDSTVLEEAASKSAPQESEQSKKECQQELKSTGSTQVKQSLQKSDQTHDLSIGSSSEPDVKSRPPGPPGQASLPETLTVTKDEGCERTKPVGDPTLTVKDETHVKVRQQRPKRGIGCMQLDRGEHDAGASAQVGSEPPGGEEENYNLDVQPLEYEDGHGMEVAVTEIESPWMLWLQPVSTALDDLIDEMDLYHTRLTKGDRGFSFDCPPRLGMLVCACYSSNKQWYRARITALYIRKGDSGSELKDPKTASAVRVFYIDFGNSELRELEMLRPLPPQFAKLQAHALPCALAEVGPPEGSTEWQHVYWTCIRLLNPKRGFCQAYLRSHPEMAIWLVDIYIPENDQMLRLPRLTTGPVTTLLYHVNEQLVTMNAASKVSNEHIIRCLPGVLDLEVPQSQDHDIMESLKCSEYFKQQVPKRLWSASRVKVVQQGQSQDSGELGHSRGPSHNSGSGGRTTNPRKGEESSDSDGNPHRNRYGPQGLARKSKQGGVSSPTPATQRHAHVPLGRNQAHSSGHVQRDRDSMQIRKNNNQPRGTKEVDSREQSRGTAAGDSREQSKGTDAGDSGERSKGTDAGDSREGPQGIEAGIKRVKPQGPEVGKNRKQPQGSEARDIRERPQIAEGGEKGGWAWGSEIWTNRKWPWWEEAGTRKERFGGTEGENSVERSPGKEAGLKTEQSEVDLLTQESSSPRESPRKLKTSPKSDCSRGSKGHKTRPSSTPLGSLKKASDSRESTPINPRSAKRTNVFSSSSGTDEDISKRHVSHCNDSNRESFTPQQKLQQLGFPARLPKECEFHRTFEKWLSGANNDETTFSASGDSMAANIESPTANIEPPIADIEPPTANIEPANIEPPIANIEPANIEPPTANIESPSANIEPPTANIESPRANIEPPTANIESPRANIEPPTANIESPRANIEPPTANIKSPRANIEPPTANIEPPEDHCLKDQSNLAECLTDQGSLTDPSRGSEGSVFNISTEADSSSYPLRTVSVPVGGCLEFMMSHIDTPSLFYIHLISGDSHHVDEIQNLLNDNYEKIEHGEKLYSSASDPKLHDMCVAKFSGDRHYYRGEVQNIADAQKGGEVARSIEVLYVDFGNSEWHSWKDLYPIDSVLAKYPRQAVCCSLNHINPLPSPENSGQGDYSSNLDDRIRDQEQKELTQRIWSKDAIKKFEEMCGFEKKLFGFVDIQGEFCVKPVEKLGLFVLDTTYEFDLCINEEMVRLGFAQSTNTLSQTNQFETKIQENEDLEMELFDPMVDDYLSPRNAYNIDVDDPGVAIEGYKSGNNQNVCRFYARGLQCWRGDRCPYDHVRIQDGLLAEKMETICVSDPDSSIVPPAESTWVAMEVSAIINPSHFYVVFPFGTQPIKELMEAYTGESFAEVEEFYIQQETMTNHYEQHPFEYQNLTVYALGEVVACKFSYDSMWYRAKVIHTEPESHRIKVFYVDFGNTEWVSESVVRQLDYRFMHIPFQAVECFLNIEPASDHGMWTAQAKDDFLALTDGKLLFAHVLDRYVNGTVTVELYDTHDGEVNIVQTLCEKGHSRPTSPATTFSRSVSSSPAPSSSSLSQSPEPKVRIRPG